MRGRRSRDLLEAKRVEVGLIGLRWLVVGFGVLETAVTIRSRSEGPDYVVPLGFVLVAALAIGNVVISTLTERASRADRIRPVGLGAFVLDIVVISGLVWTYATPENSMWVLAYLLPLEGAIRYHLVGALIAVGVSIVSEPLRELYTVERFETYAFQPAAVTFRVGVELTVAIVAGLMARSLQREADKARERAWLAEEAARFADAAAEREMGARKELAAFHSAVLAGVAAGDVDSSIRSMTYSIAHDLGFESFAILTLEADTLAAKGVHGAPGYEEGARIPLGVGVVGGVARDGVAYPSGLAAEVSDPGEPIPEVAVPLRVGSQLIGVLHRRETSPRISQDDLRMLAALADQIAMVVQAALLRDRQEETLRKLRELDEMKSDFVAITSHELRTPLAAVRGFVNTLRRRMEDLSPEETQEFLGIIDRQTDRLIRLVEDLLVVSKIEAGKLVFEPEAIEPAAFCDRVVQGLGDDGSRVTLRIHEDLPKRVLLDPHRIGQILTNLLQNALKFSPVGSPVVLSALAENGQLEFAVTDQGPGIPQDEVGRIFERFHQADAASTRSTEGAGLGLYITKKLVEAMGGAIEVESRPGEGSTFTVRLPLSPAPSPSQRFEGAQAARTAS
ncbi:MAG: HAMP domain-containing sensor histidine kinase [Actinomycetota bacterium]